MSNMSYCRFQNTDKDLRDCEEVLEEMMVGDAEPLSQEELYAAKSLAERCANIVQLIADQLGMSVEDLIDGNTERSINNALDAANESLSNVDERA